MFAGPGSHGPDRCCRDNTAGHKQSRRLLEFTDNFLLLQVIEEPIRKGVLLDPCTHNEQGACWKCEGQRQTRLQ